LLAAAALRGRGMPLPALSGTRSSALAASGALGGLEPRCEGACDGGLFDEGGAGGSERTRRLSQTGVKKPDS
jgi:hypothetical protein